MTAPRRFRFAPTSSRPLHVGSALAALIGWAAARAAGGTFILRIEDIDRTRCRPEHETQALADLRWLGLDWDEGPDVGGPLGPYRQSDRLDRYDVLLAELTARGLTYVCTCSRADVREAARAPHLHEVGSEGPPYPGTCRASHQVLRATATHGGSRLNLDLAKTHGYDYTITWKDELTGGAYREDLRLTTGDLLLGRPQNPTYQWAVVADDLAMGVTDVIRGRDLVGSTARQLLLHAVLAPTRPPPTWGHHLLLVDRHGHKLSKRDEATPLATLRPTLAPEALIAALGCAAGLWSASVQRATPADFAAALAPRFRTPAPWPDATWSLPSEPKT